MAAVRASRAELYARVPLSLAYEEGVWPHVHALYNAVATVCDLKLRAGYGSKRQLMQLAGMTRSDQFYPAREWLIDRGYLQIDVGGGRETTEYHLVDRSLEGITTPGPHTPENLAERVGDLYIRIPLTLAYEEKIRPAHHAFYNAVAAAVNFQSRTGSASWSFLSAACGLSTREALIRARKWLVSRGYLTFQTGGGRHPTRYELRTDTTKVLAHVLATQVSEAELGAFTRPGTEASPYLGAHSEAGTEPPEQQGAFRRVVTVSSPLVEAEPEAEADAGGVVEAISVGEGENDREEGTEAPSQADATPTMEISTEATRERSAETGTFLQPLLEPEIQPLLMGGPLQIYLSSAAFIAGITTSVQHHGVEITKRSLVVMAEALESGKEIKAPAAYLLAVVARLSREHVEYPNRVAERLIEAANSPSRVGGERIPQWWEEFASERDKRVMRWIMAHKHLERDERVRTVTHYLETGKLPEDVTAPL